MIDNLHVGLSTKCNLRCKYCFVPNAPLKVANIERTINFISILEMEGLKRIYHTYGEPLINKDFFTFAKKISTLGIYQVLMTNGSLIRNEETVEKIRNSGINFIYVSLDSSSPEKHDENRGVRGSYDKAVHALELLVDGKMNCGVSTAITNLNSNELIKIAEIGEELGVSNISFLAERNLEEVSIDITEQYLRLFKEAVFNDKKFSFHDARLNKYLKSWFADQKISEATLQYFHYGNSCKKEKSLSLSPNGEMFRCNFLQGTILGNLNEINTISDFKEINKKIVKGCTFVG